MKKLLVLFTAVLLAVSCSLKSGSLTDEFSSQDYTYYYKEGKIEVKLNVEYPKSGDAILVQAIREYVSETLGGSYDGSLDNGKLVTDFYGEKMKSELLQAYDEEKKDLEEENINGFSKQITIKKDYETDKLITLVVSEEVYMNGAHGSAFCFGMTFRKSDGRRFTPEMMVGVQSEGMHTMIKEGLRKYFGQTEEKQLDDEELKEFIISDDHIENLPMPTNAPYVTKDGIVFIYQQYEISFYAAGMPSFVVPLDKMKPYLTHPAKEMLGIHSDK